jgi:DNA-binding NarL/FixJ family response regulator
MHRTRIGGRGVLRGLIADRQPLWQNLLAATLLRLGFGMLTVCDSPDELDELVAKIRPHLVLVDPEGFRGAVDDFEAGGVAPVVLVSARAHASDGRPFVSKCAAPGEVERALRSVVSAHLGWSTLTKRELEILHLAGDGLSNRQIARALWLSDQTVKFHLAKAYRKLGVTDRRAAVERLRDVGLLLEGTPPTEPGHTPGGGASA